MSQTPTHSSPTNDSFFDTEAVPTEPLLTAVTSLSTCSAEQPPSRERFGKYVSEKSLQQAPCSPSPRGIETWGPCSPFNLPNPSTTLALLEPAEISRILDDTLSDSNSLEFATIRKTHQLVLPPSTNFGSQFIHGESCEEFKQLVAHESGNAGITNGLCSVNDFEFSDNAASYLECHPAFVNTCSDQETRDSAGSSTFPRSHNYVSFDGRADGCRSDEVINVATVQDNLSQDEYDLSILSRKRTWHVDQMEAGIDSTAYDLKCDEFYCNTSRDEGSASKRMKYSLPNDHDDEDSHDASKQGGSSNGRKMTEEEVKRIRRVKNRASVEKCRTKQRLRMEALQCELNELRSENQTLRDLTTWMDSSVEDISSQVAELRHNGKG